MAPAAVTLRAAMATAAERDRIAWNYVHDFADVFELGLPRLRAASMRWGEGPWPAAAAFLAFLASFADTHIEREHGRAAAEEVRLAAVPLDRALTAADEPEPLSQRLLAWDAELKARGLNPGTSADLTVASLFLRRLEDALDGR